MCPILSPWCPWPFRPCAASVEVPSLPVKLQTRCWRSKPAQIGLRIVRPSSRFFCLHSDSPMRKAGTLKWWCSKKNKYLWIPCRDTIWWYYIEYRVLNMIRRDTICSLMLPHYFYISCLQYYTVRSAQVSLFWSDAISRCFRRKWIPASQLPTAKSESSETERRAASKRNLAEKPHWESVWQEMAKFSQGQ